MPDVESQTDEVQALRAELRTRAGVEAHLRGQLADVAAELEARTEASAWLEGVLVELREELEQLRSLIGSRSDAEHEGDHATAELARVRVELVTSEVAREAAAGEVAGLRAELERLAGEKARGVLAGEGSRLGEAEALLAEARALRTRVLGRQAGVGAEGQ